MFERFTDGARQVVVFAEEEAGALRHNYIGTEHILLGLLREQEGLAAGVLESFGINLEDARARIVQVVGEGEEVVTGRHPEGAGKSSPCLRRGLVLVDEPSEHVLAPNTAESSDVFEPGGSSIGGRW